MKSSFSIAALLVLSIIGVKAQDTLGVNGSGKILKELSSQKLVIGGYGQIDYNQTLESGYRQNGNLDVHRLVMFLGYSFSSKTSLVTEIEYEHVSEVYIEQAFIEHRISSAINLIGGLLLIPMGIVNQYHEPTTFNGVERPTIDSKVVPTTWREIGLGINGRFTNAALSYQLLLVNGLKSYDEKGLLGGSKGIRSGRQKGAESIISSPNVALKINYFGLSGLQIGAATFLGKTQSTLYHHLDTSNKDAVERADSSRVGIRMFGLDYRFSKGNFHSRGQLIFNNISNTKAYNQFTGQDLGSQTLGWYLEGAWDIRVGNEAQNLTPFVRYESYNLHHRVAPTIPRDGAYNVKEITAGAGYSLAPGVVVKADIAWAQPQNTQLNQKQFNMGIGFWF